MTLDDFTLSGWLMGTINDAQDWHDYYGLDTTNGGQLRFEANNNNPPRIHIPASVITHPNFYTSNGADGKMTRDVWHHLVFTGSGGKLTGYIDGELDAQVDFLEGAQVSGIYIGMANNNSAGAYHDEVGFHKVARHQRWIKATYDNQLTGSSYSSLANFAGPPFFEDTVTELYGKKNTAISNFTPTVFAGGTPAYTAAGLPPGITINSSTGEISGSTDEVGSSTFTITATGTNAAGETRTASKTYEIKISDPDSYPYKVDFTLSGYTRFLHFESISGSAEIRFWN